MTTDSERNSLRIIWIGWWVTLLTVSDYSFVSPLLPDFLKKFEVDLSESSWILAAYQLGAASVVLLAGLYVDRVGCRLVLTVSMVAFGLGEALSGWSPLYSVFLAGRFLVGAGSAAASLALTTYIGLHIDYRERGKVMGFIGTAFFLGMTFGPLLTTQLADRGSLLLLFLVYTVLAFIGAFHAGTSLDPDKDHRKHKQWKDFLEVGRNRGFWGIVVVQTLFTISVVPMIQYFGTWLEAVHHLSTQERGVVFAIGGIPIIAGSPVGGWICDRVGKKPFFALLTGLLALLTCTMPYMNAYSGVVLIFSLVGFVAAARYSTYHALCTRLIEEDLLGHLISARNFINYLATALGVVMMGWVYESSAVWGYLWMGWLATLMLLVSIPFLLKMIPGEPALDLPDGEAVAT